MQHGFDRDFAGDANAALSGRGSYFARDASYSADPKYAKRDRNGVQWMALCRVARGKSVRGNRSSTKFSTVTQGAHSTHNTTGDVFVTYADAQAYPEFLIGFKS